MRTRKGMKCSALLLAAAIFLSALALPVSAEEAGSFDHFVRSESYTPGMFKDVKANSWYEENVAAVYEYGLMVGVSNDRFDITGNITVAETFAIMARLRKIYYTGSASLPKTKPWYKSSVDYLIEEGVLSHSGWQYSKAMSRQEFAYYMHIALPEEMFEEINSIEQGAIPDVESGSAFAPDIYAMYRAGILAGNDSKGTFTPKATIERRAVAAIIDRIANPAHRISVSLSTPASPLSVRYDVVSCVNSAMKIDQSSSSLMGDALDYLELYRMTGSGAMFTKAVEKGKAIQENGRKSKVQIDRAVKLCSNYKDLATVKDYLYGVLSYYNDITGTSFGSTYSSFLEAADTITQAHLGLITNYDTIVSAIPR